MFNIQAKKLVLPLALLILSPAFCFGMGRINDFHFSATLISIFNFILLITSLICIVQYFARTMHDHRTFHIVNMIFIVVFYWISLTFLISNKEYYAGYEHLSDAQCIKKLFFSPSLYVLKHWIIAFALIINVLYVMRQDADGELETKV